MSTPGRRHQFGHRKFNPTTNSLEVLPSEPGIGEVIATVVLTPTRQPGRNSASKGQHYGLTVLNPDSPTLTRANNVSSHLSEIDEDYQVITADKYTLNEDSATPAPDRGLSEETKHRLAALFAEADEIVGGPEQPKQVAVTSPSRREKEEQEFRRNLSPKITSVTASGGNRRHRSPRSDRSEMQTMLTQLAQQDAERAKLLQYLEGLEGRQDLDFKLEMKPFQDDRDDRDHNRDRERAQEREAASRRKKQFAALGGAGSSTDVSSIKSSDINHHSQSTARSHGTPGKEHLEPKSSTSTPRRKQPNHQQDDVGTSSKEHDMIELERQMQELDSLLQQKEVQSKEVSKTTAGSSSSLTEMAELLRKAKLREKIEEEQEKEVLAKASEMDPRDLVVPKEIKKKREADQREKEKMARLEKRRGSKAGKPKEAEKDLKRPNSKSLNRSRHEENDKITARESNQERRKREATEKEKAQQAEQSGYGKSKSKKKEKLKTSQKAEQPNDKVEQPSNEIEDDEVYLGFLEEKQQLDKINRELMGLGVEMSTISPDPTIVEQEDPETDVLRLLRMIEEYDQQEKAKLLLLTAEEPDDNFAAEESKETTNSATAASEEDHSSGTFLTATGEETPSSATETSASQTNHPNSGTSLESAQVQEADLISVSEQAPNPFSIANDRYLERIDSQLDNFTLGSTGHKKQTLADVLSEVKTMRNKMSLDEIYEVEPVVHELLRNPRMRSESQVQVVHGGEYRDIEEFFEPVKHVAPSEEKRKEVMEIRRELFRVSKKIDKDVERTRDIIQLEMGGTYLGGYRAKKKKKQRDDDDTKEVKENDFEIYDEDQMSAAECQQLVQDGVDLESLALDEDDDLESLLNTPSAKEIDAAFSKNVSRNGSVSRKGHMHRLESMLDKADGLNHASSAVPKLNLRDSREDLNRNRGGSRPSSGRATPRDVVLGLTPKGSASPKPEKLSAEARLSKLFAKVDNARRASLRGVDYSPVLHATQSSSRNSTYKEYDRRPSVTRDQIASVEPLPTLFRNGSNSRLVNSAGRNSSSSRESVSRDGGRNNNASSAVVYPWRPRSADEAEQTQLARTHPSSGHSPEPPSLPSPHIDLSRSSSRLQVDPGRDRGPRALAEEALAESEVLPATLVDQVQGVGANRKKKLQ
eukprot:CAMPEP_0175121122 /NCGR_PEP_ID=MMETSP0087-20121206/994_1 /TAXON_ID=136419 /ORGANISM="Unknown Unknown, Strain D1" /LENGTH=1152 /DNA_ID=CAMNT_0016402631 /DNA_START=91 /DNA_END=3550 /DNA_ORIENTATION=-